MRLLFLFPIDLILLFALVNGAEAPDGKRFPATPLLLQLVARSTA